jgi:hypothetical protein
MLVLKYFAFVGAALFVLLCGWAGYLLPAGMPASPARVSVDQAVVFRPTPPPPIAKGDAPAFVGVVDPIVANDKAKKSVATSAKPKKRKTQVARQRTTAQRTFAYVPDRRYFFGWR